MLKSLSEERGLIYADVYSAEAGCPHVVHMDTVHANKIGNMLIAQRVFEAIVRASPGVAQSVQRRDATSAWADLIRPNLPSGRGPSETSRPGQ